MNLKSQGAIMRRRFESFKSDMEELKKTIKTKDEDIKKLRDELDERQRQIDVFKVLLQK